MIKFHKKNLLELYVKGIIAKKYTYQQASESTGYTIRHLQCMKKRYIKEGKSCFRSGHIGKPCPTRIPQETRNRIVALYAAEYKELNFKFYLKCLAEFEGIKISYSTLMKILSDSQIESPESHRSKTKSKVHRPRQRRANEGDLSQVDATPYDWFGNGQNYSLHGAIDDATGKLTALYMCENECLYGYLECLRITAKKFGGTPREIYSDRAGIFCVTPKNKQNLTVEEQLIGIHEKRTQWQRILDEIGSKQILAFSPQAKGRIERVWETLQGRLPFLFKKFGIKSMEAANKWLEEVYLDMFNSEFGLIPAKSANFYHPQNMAELDAKLVAKYPRQLNHGSYFSFHAYKFVVKDYKGRKQIGNVCVSEKGITYEIDGKFYPTKIIFEPQFTDYDKHYTSQVLYNIIWRCIMRDGKKEDYEVEAANN